MVKKFSDRLRQVRLLRRYTQAELAQLAGLSQSAVASYESGERKFSRGIFKLAAALHVDAQWLETGKGSMERSSEPYDTSAGRGRYAVMESYPESAYDPANPNSWPFANIPRSDYDQLTPRNKKLLENIMASFIEACQTTDSPSKSRKQLS